MTGTPRGLLAGGTQAGTPTVRLVNDLPNVR